jgi:hypothetical protein
MLLDVCDTCDRPCLDTRIAEHDVICADCRDRDWAACSHCRAWLPREQMGSDEGGWLCRSCADGLPEADAELAADTLREESR